MRTITLLVLSALFLTPSAQAAEKLVSPFNTNVLGANPSRPFQARRITTPACVAKGQPVVLRVQQPQTGEGFIALRSAEYNVLRQMRLNNGDTRITVMPKVAKGVIRLAPILRNGLFTEGLPEYSVPFLRR